MKFDEIQKALQLQLQTLYEDREAYNISMLVMEKMTGLRKVEWLLEKQKTATECFQNSIEHIANQLLQNKPVQYVLEEAWFMGLPFYVKEGVLIPRPETEELTDWIITSVQKESSEKVSILDIGTGSGCIAISLDKYIDNSELWAFDFSPEALIIANKNNDQLGTNVLFQKKDILTFGPTDYHQKWDIIVSNPPYICNSEGKDMHPNVLQYEPTTALFVPDEDPFLFYRKIGILGTNWLKNGGFLYFEINELFGKEIVGLLSDIGYQDITLKKDLQGKDRMVKALWLVN